MKLYGGATVEALTERTTAESHKRKEVLEGHDRLYPEGTWHRAEAIKMLMVD